MRRDIEAFDHDHEHLLSRIWFLGDVHGKFEHIARALDAADEKPRWLVFLGDVEICDRPFREVLTQLLPENAGVQVLFIHGNHDADSHEHWKMLHDCGSAVDLHNRVIDLDGVKLAGLGGNFMGRVWYPPSDPLFQSKLAAMNRGSFQLRDGQKPNSKFNAAIYPQDVQKLSNQRADILVSHEAPSPHPHGFAAIDDLARAMQVCRTFHGHQHDDRSDEYRKVRSSLGFDAMAVGFRAIKDGLGKVIDKGEVAW